MSIEKKLIEATNAGDYAGFGKHRRIVKETEISVPEKFCGTELEYERYVSAYKRSNRDAYEEYAE